jgi:allantoin racemase
MQKEPEPRGLPTKGQIDMVKIKVVTPVITPGLRDIADLRALEHVGLRIEHCILDEGPSSIESVFEELLAAPGVLSAALQAQQEGCDAVVIDCFGDPGLQAARELLDIAVLGPGESSMHAAAMLGQRFSVVTVLESVRPMIHDLALRYGLASKLASIRVIDVPVLSLHADMKALHEAMAEQARRAIVEDGADVIVLGCTGFLGCAESIRMALTLQGLDVPVLDPIPVTLHMAQAFVAGGLRHSKRGWPKPANKPIAGFAILQRRLS